MAKAHATATSVALYRALDAVIRVSTATNVYAGSAHHIVPFVNQMSAQNAVMYASVVADMYVATVWSNVMGAASGYAKTA